MTVKNVKKRIASAIIRSDPFDQGGIHMLISVIHGTKNKSGLGARAIRVVSFAAAKAIVSVSQLHCMVTWMVSMREHCQFR
jgi:enolase